jgi:hypothetical protein
VPPTTHSPNPLRTCHDSAVGMGGARRGRRDNGLVATEYAVAGDVDPRVGEHLLDVLAAGGIAAYLQPAADLHPVTRTTTVPARPTDRLYVDREHIATAREYLTELAEPDPVRPAPTGAITPAGTPAPAGAPIEPRTAAEPAAEREAGPERGERPERDAAADDPAEAAAEAGQGTEPVPEVPGSDANSDAEIDEAFARIVANLKSDLATTGDERWPDLDDDENSKPTPAFRVIDRRRRVRSDEPAKDEKPAQDQEPSLLDGLDTFGAHLPDDEDEGTYTPPPPPPLPRPSGAAVLAVIAIVAGFILFLWPSLLPIGEDVARMLGFAGCAGGFATLVWRMRPGDDEEADRDPDDGAVV